jgi:hypothetical protein
MSHHSAIHFLALVQRLAPHDPQCRKLTDGEIWFVQISMMAKPPQKLSNLPLRYEICAIRHLPNLSFNLMGSHFGFVPKVSRHACHEHLGI